MLYRDVKEVTIWDFRSPRLQGYIIV